MSRIFTIGFLSLISSLVVHGQTSWSGGAGPGNFTTGSNWNSGAPLNQAAFVDTTAGTITIFLTAPSPNPYTVDGLTVTGTNTLTFNHNSGVLTFASGAIDFGTSNSIYNLTGTSSILMIGGTNGITGTGTLNLVGGILQVINSDLTIGSNVNTTLATNVYSVVNTNGLNATFGGSVTGATGGLFKAGTGVLTLNGSNNTVGSFLVSGGGISQSTGTLTTAELAVGTGTVTGTPGGLGNTGTYTMNGGSLTFPGGTTPAIAGGGTSSSFRVGDYGGTGTFIQQSGTITLGAAGQAAALTIGNQGGTGTYNLQGGSITVADGYIDLGRSTSSSWGLSSGTLNVSGGTIEIQNGAYLALGGNISPATANQGTGVLTQTAGTIIIDTGGSFYLSAYGTGTYNFNGGVLEVGGNGLQARFGAGAPTTNFNLGGGTIQVTGTFLASNVDMNLVANTYSIINTNGLGASLSGTINGATGGLAKIGTGDLALTSPSNTIGSFLVAGGSVSQSTGTLTTTELAVGTGTGNSASYNMTGGTLIFPSGTPPPIVGGTASSFRIGDFGGTGTFTQSGGSVSDFGSMDIGNQGGVGTYNISGGSLYLSGGLYDLGRTTSSSTGTSTGIMNISGSAAVTVDGAGVNFIIGDRDNTGLQGTGIVNQTGGTFTIENGAGLFLAGYGTGTYNLTGGVLQVGGSGLNAHYGSGGTYQFNFGGGTIQVIGSALTTDVDMNLVANTYSIINTNGLGASLSGTINGATGGLVKIGTGDLALTGANNSIGSFLVAGGSVTQSTGTLTSTELAVGTGTGNSATYNMTGGTLIFPSGTPPPIVGGTASSFRIGDFGGTGTFTQSGGNVLDIGAMDIGNQGGVGTYNISGGNLVLSGGLYGLGRTTSSVTTAGSGTLNISGAANVTVLDGNFIIGDRDASGSQGTGTVNQSGGTFTIDSGAGLFLSAYGNGTYNLTGGTLQIGGNSLSTHYGGSASYQFNLGGGTIQVIGSDLAVNADATLVGTSTSTIDTGTFNASWTGSLTGSGNLAKAGTGTFTASNINTTGAFDLQNGTVVSSGASNVVDQLAVDAGHATYLQVSNGGTLNLSTSGRVYQNSTLNFSGGGTLTSGGTFTVGDASTSGTLNLNGGTANFQNGVVVGNTPGSVGTINQTGGLANLTGGSLDLKQSTSTYNLSGGQFAVGGSGVKGSGQLNVNGGTLSGNGLVSVATVVSSNGVIAPGSTTAGIHTPGQLTFSNLSLNSGSILAWNLANESVSGPGLNFDQIQASAGGNILLNGALTLNLAFGSGIDFNDAFWSTTQTWDIIDVTAGGASLIGTASFTINSTGGTGGYFNAVQIGNQVDLTWTPVPEPSTWLLLGGGFLLLLLIKRKRRA